MPPPISWIKQKLSSQHLLSHIVVELSWMPLPENLSQACHPSVIWVVGSSEGPSGEQSASNWPSWWLAGFSSSKPTILRPLVLTGHWLKAFLRSMPSGPFHRIAPKMAAGFPPSERRREQEWTRSKSQSLHNPISQVTFHPFCPTMFFRKESLGPAHT